MVGGLAELASGEGKIFRVGKSAIAVSKSNDGQVQAFSAICTHLGCVIQYQPEKKLFHCNCHDSEFDLRGKNLSGPASMPLPSRRVEMRKEGFFVSES
jgi:Rieske Fe-S protein